MKFILYMRVKKFYKPERAKNGEGRKTENKHVLVSDEVKRKLDIYKAAYTLCFKQSVSFDQMFRDWMDHGRIDSNVLKFLKDSNLIRTDSVDEEGDAPKLEVSVDGHSLEVQEVDETPVVVSSVEEEGADLGISGHEFSLEIANLIEQSRETFEREEAERAKRREAERQEWEKRRLELRANKKKYFFVRGDERLEARLSKGNGASSSFTADLDGRPRGFDEFAKRGYILINEDDETIDRQTAIDIKREYDDFYRKPTTW